MFDQELQLVVWNRAFRDLRDYPAALCRAGTAIADLYRFNAERGDYGAGAVDEQVRLRLTRARSRQAHEFEYELASGRTLSRLSSKPRSSAVGRRSRSPPSASS